MMEVSVHLLTCLLVALIHTSNTTVQWDNKHIGQDTKTASHPARYSYDWRKQTGHSKEEGWIRYKANVQDCPKTCMCYLLDKGTYLLIGSCKTDPIDDLPSLFKSHANITKLEIASCHLSRLPPEVLILKKLSILDVDGNGLQKVPDEALSMVQLVELTLSGNDIQTIPTDIARLSKLQLLDIGRNRLECIPSEITELAQLHTLILDNNKIAQLPRHIERLSKLQHLELSHNQLTYVPLGIGQLSRLQLLSLCFNELHGLSEELWNLTQLEWLFLCNNHIETVPAELGRLINLQSLDLDHNKIRKMPQEIYKIEHLYQLSLDHNILRQIPDNISKTLQSLFLGHNEIQTVSCYIFNLHGLKYIDLSSNFIKAMKCETVDIYALQYLNLSYNALEEMPCDLFFPQIRTLAFQHNRIQTFFKPCSLLQKDLHYLDLSFNRISRILHNWILCLGGKLTYVNFSNNNITNIESGVFSQPDCLQPSATVDLSNNRISIIESWPLILSMSSSVTVDLSGNRLSGFTSNSTFIPSGHFGSVFRMQRNHIRHFIDVFNGWKIMVNTSESIKTLFENALFDLGDNPLICDCKDYEVFRYIQISRRVQYNDLMCYEPHGLKGENPQNISLERFVCDMNGTSCPVGCICTNIPHFTTVEIICERYNQKDLPDVIPNLPKQIFGYQLNFCNQNLRKISLRPYLWKARKLILSNNSITAIKILSRDIFQDVVVLHLDNNYLQALPKSIIAISNKTAVDVRLGNNPWVCDCQAINMKDWIVSNQDMIKDKEHIICHSPPSMAGSKMIDMERSLVCPNENRIVVCVVVIIAVLVLVFMIYLIVTERLKYANWRLVGSDECDGEGKEFDVFVSYANEDEEYVEGYLIPELEERQDFRVCFHRVHFHGGKPIHVNMSEAIEKSKRTLVFFSSNFKESNFGMFEFHTALHLDIQNNTRRLITIKDTNLNVNDLEIADLHYFQTHTYIRREDKNFLRNLLYTLPRKRLGARYP